MKVVKYQFRKGAFCWFILHSCITVHGAKKYQSIERRYLDWSGLDWTGLDWTRLSRKRCRTGRIL